MKSLGKSSRSCSANATSPKLIAQIVDSGLGIRDWAKRNGQGISSTYDLCLRGLAGDEGLRSYVLGLVDHSAARVYCGTGDREFDRFVGTILAMQVLARGLSRKEALEHLSMELLDPFVDLREDGKVTRGWLDQLMSRKCRGSKNGVYRFGELVRIAVLASSLLGYHDGDPLFMWAVENREGIEASSLQQWSRVMRGTLEGAGYPGFELWVVRYHEHDIVRKVDFDTDSLFCRRLLRESTFEMDNWSDTQHMNGPFFNEFVQSLGFTPRRLEDFTVDTFTRQVDWFRDKPGRCECTYRFLRRFYMRLIGLLPDGQRQFSFETGLPPQLFEYHRLFGYWLEGCRAVLHNPLDPVPTYDKWFLYPTLDEMARTNVSPSPVAMDLTFDDQRVKSVLKEWLWHECENVYYIRRLAPRLKRFFALVMSDSGWQLDQPSIGLRPVVEYVTVRSSEIGQSGIRHAKGWLKSILRYGERTGRWRVDGPVYLYLDAGEKSDRWAPDETTAVPLEDLAKVLDELGRRADRSLFERCVYTALCVQSLTPLRIGDILAIERKDLVKSEGGTTRFVDCSTKTDIYGKRRIQIPLLAGKLIDALAERTEELAKDPRDGIHGRVFLYPGHAHGSVSFVDSYQMGVYIDSACDAVGVARFNPRDVRRRYETEVVQRGIRHNLSRLALRPLTGHSSLDITERYYVREDIREYLEAVHGIEIGTPELRGEVDDTAPTSVDETEDVVEGGAGYCRNAECNIAGTVSCLMCSGFVTTPDCIPEMESAIAALNGRIRDVGYNTHERDHLLAVKQLYLAYLVRMYQIKEDRSAGSES